MAFPLPAVRCIMAVHGRMNQKPGFHMLPDKEYEGLHMWQASEQFKPVMDGADQVDTERWLRITRHVDHMLTENARVEAGKLEERTGRITNQARGLTKAIKAERDTKEREGMEKRLAAYEAELAEIAPKLAEYMACYDARTEVVTEWPIGECV